MKILVVQDRLRSGGTERQSAFLSAAFAQAGHEVTLLTFRPGGKLAATVAPDVRQGVLQPFDTGLDWFAPGLKRAVAAERPDIVLCMGRMANCHAHAAHAVLARQHPGGAVLCTMRTGKRLPLLFRRSLRVCRHVVANSHDAESVLTGRYGVPAAKISVIHNSLVFPPPVDAAAAARDRTTLRERFGAGAGTTVLLCVAMFRPEKNQRELIEIAAGLGDGDWQLWLAGEGPARAGCERLTVEKKLGDRVKFVGFHRDPTALYRAADVAVHASWSESLSNFIIEAQAHGLPAVAYVAQGMAECCVPEQTGWVIARDDRGAFRERLRRLMSEDGTLRAQRSRQAQTFARQTFDPQRQVEAYLQLFQQLHRA
jgi:glycosyltransferase involved in cell wall biosynthesis